MGRTVNYRLPLVAVVAFVAVVAVLVLAGCGKSLVPVTGEPVPVDLNAIPICATMDGAAPGQAYPCVWEEAHEEARPYPGIRWVWYVRDYCPSLVALPEQVGDGVKCIDVRQWITVS
jgi:hypothetical protein